MPTLEWIGKDKVVNHHQEVPFRILDKKYTFNAENFENMIIHGDNLLALKSLLPKYEGLIAAFISTHLIIQVKKKDNGCIVIMWMTQELKNGLAK